MRRIFTIFFLCILGFLSAFSQTTIQKDRKEFFNGDDRHLRAYLNNNYDQLDPIEGIWIFTRIEYNTYGQEVSRTPNEITAAIVRDPDNLRRAFLEVNMSRAFCKDYQVTYSIQTGGGSGYYPCEPEGCGVLSGQYYFDYQYKTLSRPAISLMGNRAVLVGIKTYPQGPPTKILLDPGGTASSTSRQVTKRQPHIITHESGWEPHIDWDNQIFSSYILGTASTDPKLFHISDDYLGDPLSVVGIVIKNPRYRSEVEIEIEPTKYSKSVKETFTIEERGKQFAIYPKIIWDFDLLRCLKDPTPLNLTFKVSINGREPTTQTVTANLRTIDDCPLLGYDYRGELTDLTFMAAAYVDEGSKIVTTLKKEIREKGVVRDFVGLQEGEGVAIEIVYAFWQLLRGKGISYSNATNNGQESQKVASQRIRLLADVIDETQANCVDGTALFASCLAPSDIPPIIVLVPNHAFLGYTIGYIPQQGGAKSKPVNLYLETTMLGTKAKFSAKFYDLIKTEPYSEIRELLYKKFSKGNAEAKKEIDYFIFATMVGNLRREEEYKTNPHRVIEVDIKASRFHVRAIHHCNETTSHIPTEKDDKQDNDTLTYDEQEGKTTTKLRRKGTKDYDDDAFLTDALDTNNDIFRVQIEKCSAFIPNKKEYEQLSKYGKIYPEYLLEKKSYRIMLGEFNTEKSAQKAAKKAQSLGFKYVLIVRYQKGNRFENMYQDWKLISD